MQSYNSPAKVNIFLKITGTRGNYHEILSRFMRIDSLYDTLTLVPKKESEFRIDGNFTCKIQDNTIYKAYKALYAHTKSQKLKNLMQEYAIHVQKSIPAFAGLGGGSSNAATFLHLCNEHANLKLSIAKLSQIGAQVGADLPFFIHGYSSANVSGIGEIVEPFEEESIAFDIFTPKIEISTPAVYQEYRRNFFNPIDTLTCKELAKESSRSILKRLRLSEANDLFEPALALYPDLSLHVKEDNFFSGSGSSFFTPKDIYG
ncbi:MAG: 4-(cytidine 5'-diphospho)-2-C-methyl-D-erythritol kinase [Campylobacterota bacterium]|nr:4-(cytidine 5'-diphospho)-2-C-methyl-D-erythritol kinase [Campylobacterota bacterium]